MNIPHIKRPEWMTVLGVIGIALGALGVMGSLQAFIMPQMLRLEQHLFRSFADAAASEGAKGPGTLFEFFADNFTIPEWFKSWIIISGIIGLFVAGYFIYASIQLINSKPNSLKLYIRAVWFRVALIVAGIACALTLGSLFAFAAVAGGTFGLAIDAVLLIIAYLHRREFQAYMARLYPQDADQYINSQG